MTSPTPPVPASELRQVVAGKLWQAYFNSRTDIIAGKSGHAISILDNYTDEIMQLFESTMLSVIGDIVVPNMHSGLLHNNQEAQNRLRKAQYAKLYEVLGKQSEEEK